ncbi:unnamed protein product [Rhizoctonia solani]|uniref:Peptidase C14 caspase domain-containing protein n=1 Tax=Rhizoctonia solani TaxID=456999 RepID=A0A8H3DME4_9AGAM|nr:unnamed protein product [Rhizoctonia solani]
MRSTERGPSKPAVQCRPTYVEEQLVHSPTEDRVCRVSETLTNATRGSEIRGRTDAVAQPGAARQPISNPGAQPTSSWHQQEKTTIRPPRRAKSYVRRIHTAPYSFDFMFHTSEPRNTLLGSLKGFPLHSAAPVQNTSVHVLGVGLSWDHVEGRALPGPAHDIRWLENFFSYQKQVRFRSLQDEKASFDAIHQTIAHIYVDIGPNDYLILYFTGHGDDNNALELYDNGSGPLSEVILNEWIVELRRRTTKRIPVHIVFDFCRLSPVKSSAELDSDVNVLYSCPPGQISPDLKLSNDLPYSCLLMALLLAIHDSSERHAPSLVKSLALRLTELLNVVWGTRCYRLGPGRRKRWCRHLQSCELCQDEKHGPYNEDPWPNPQLFGMFENMHLGGAHDFSAAVRYASTRFPLPLRKAYELLENNQWFMYFNPSRISTNKGSSTSGTRKFRPCDARTKLESIMSTRGKTLPLGAVSAPSKPK